ncbi:MAG: ribonuclease D [Cognaticolwellia sp.]
MVVVAPPTWVDTEDALNETLEHLKRAVEAGRRIALDTEFHSEHRYNPRLMLIQLATTAGEAILIDPLALPNLRQLGRVLAGAQLILHAPGHDLPLLAKRCGLQANDLQDPQLIAGFSGMGHPKSLSHLCSEVLGVSLTKGSTLSDWKKRPLSAEQQEYAADDVRYLHPLTQALQERLAPELRPALAACTAERTRSALTLPRPDQSWRRFGVARVLDSRSLCALVALCTWREKQARERDQPTRQVLGDGLLIDLARRLPASVEELSTNRRFPKRLLKEKGELLLEIVAASATDSPPMMPDNNERSRARRACFDAFLALRALETGVSDKLLLPEEDRDQALTGNFHSAWRKEILEPAMSQFLQGESPIRMPS